MDVNISDQDKRQLLLFTKYLMTWGLDYGTFYIDGNEGLGSIDLDDFDNVRLSEKYDLKIPQNIKAILKDLAYQALNYADMEDDFDEDFGYSQLEVIFQVQTRKLTISVSEDHFVDNPVMDTQLASNDPKLDAIIEELKELTSETVLELTYEGSGDSGYLKDEFEDGLEVPQSVIHYCYVWLEQDHGGWEIDDGSDGIFIFNLKNKTVTLHHNWYERKTEEKELLEFSLV